MVWRLSVGLLVIMKNILCVCFVKNIAFRFRLMEHLLVLRCSVSFKVLLSIWNSDASMPILTCANFNSKKCVPVSPRRTFNRNHYVHVALFQLSGYSPFEFHFGTAKQRLSYVEFCLQCILAWKRKVPWLSPERCGYGKIMQLIYWHIIGWLEYGNFV